MSDPSIGVQLVDAGYTKPITHINDVTKEEAVKTLALHHCILSVKTEPDELYEGMTVGGIRAGIQKHAQAFWNCFIAGEVEPLTAGSPITVSTCYRNCDIYFVIDTVRDLFETKLFSEKGCNEWQKEKAAYMHCLSLLEACEGTSSLKMNSLQVD